MYFPQEDSFLLSECLKKYLKKKSLKKEQKSKDIKILDLGSGTGIQAETCKKLRFNNLTVADINPEPVKFLRKKGFKTIKSNLFSNIDNKNKFDLIIFNPPYLPEDKYDKEPDTVGGKKGYEIILKFLRQARNHLSKKGSILLLFSSLSKPEIIKRKIKEIGYKIKLLNKKRLFFEELFVIELKKKKKKNKEVSSVL